MALAQFQCPENPEFVGCQIVVDYNDKLKFCTSHDTANDSLESCTFLIDNDSGIVFPASGPNETFEIPVSGYDAGHKIESFCKGKDEIYETPVSELRTDEFCHYKNPDLDGDGVVGLVDFGIISTCFIASKEECDLNHDGVVGLVDFGIFTSKLGQRVDN